MVGQGGEVRPTIGNPNSDTIVVSGTVISGALNLQNIQSLRWRGSLLASGHAGGVGGALVSGRICHSETGFMEISLSGQQVWLAYWVSA